MTATYAQTVTYAARAFRNSNNGDTALHLALDCQLIAAATAAGIDHATVFMDLADEIAAPALYAPQVGDVVIFHGNKAGRVSASGGHGPFPVISDDTRDEPCTFYWLHAYEMAPAFG